MRHSNHSIRKKQEKKDVRNTWKCRYSRRRKETFWKEQSCCGKCCDEDIHLIYMCVAFSNLNGLLNFVLKARIFVLSFRQQRGVLSVHMDKALRISHSGSPLKGECRTSTTCGSTSCLELEILKLSVRLKHGKTQEKEFFFVQCPTKFPMDLFNLLQFFKN